MIGMALALLPLVYFVYNDVSWKPLNPYQHLIQHGLTYLFLLVFSYINYTAFVPRWFLTRRYGRYALVTIGCLFGVAFLPYRIEQWLFFKPPQQHTPLAWARRLFLDEMMFDGPPVSPYNLRLGERFPSTEPLPTRDLPHFPEGSPTSVPPPGSLAYKPPTGIPILIITKLAIFFLLGSVSTLLSVSLLMANRLRQVENDQLKAELRQLKAQIQPHFLFNTLNSIYSLSIRKDERTPETIVKLSEFMRYIIRDAHQDKVPLLTEVNYLANYIDLQKARLRDAVQVDYRVVGDGSRLQIAPLLLFSFIENAFKYGVNPEEDSPLAIHLNIQEKGLRLLVANNKVQVNLLEQSTGIGLQNTRERLRLLYPANHQLTIDDTPTHFRITLLLTLS